MKQWRRLVGECILKSRWSDDLCTRHVTGWWSQGTESFTRTHGRLCCRPGVGERWFNSTWSSQRCEGKQTRPSSPSCRQWGWAGKKKKMPQSSFSSSFIMKCILYCCFLCSHIVSQGIWKYTEYSLCSVCHMKGFSAVSFQEYSCSTENTALQKKLFLFFLTWE